MCFHAYPRLARAPELEVLEDERARELERARRGDPAPEPCARRDELQLRHAQRALEVRRRELPVVLGKLAQERRLEAGGDVGHRATL
jgi:hypothetical protein